MKKLDLKKTFKSFYTAKAEVNEVDIPSFNYLMIDGLGLTETNSEFENAIQALYGLAYTIKFHCKKQDKDFVVMPLQGLWWMKNMSEWSMNNKEKWQWTLMIAMPDMVSAKMVEQMRLDLSKKKKVRALDDVRFEQFHEGRAVQIMHIGSYEDEPPTIQKLHHYAKSKGYKFRGKHHEIYLGDPRKVENDYSSTDWIKRKDHCHGVSDWYIFQNHPTQYKNASLLPRGRNISSC